MRRRLRSEEGVALTVAIFTLAVIALFSALVASTAGQLSDTSNNDRDSKKALGAAQAGLNTALHRFNTNGPVGNLGCLTDVVVGVTAVATPYPGITAAGRGELSVQAGECPGATGRAGNDGTWTYWPTLLNNGQACDEQYTTEAEVNNLVSFSAGGISVLRRCITSIGVVNGVQRRVQREIYSTFRLFEGLIADEQVSAAPGANLGTSHVGANGRDSDVSVTMASGSIYSGQVEVPDASKVEIDATGVWGVTEQSAPWLIDPIDVPNGAAGSITCLGPLLDALCTSSTRTGGLESGRRLYVPTGYTVTINDGDHYLCRLTITGGRLLVVGNARVFIDDDAANCPNGTGGFTMDEGLVNTGALVTAQNFRVFVEGGNHPVSVDGGEINVTLYAPETSVTVTRGSSLVQAMKGSITAKSISFGQNTTFVGDALLDIAHPFEQIGGRWHPGDWSECPAKPAGDSPHEGCNG